MILKRFYEDSLSHASYLVGCPGAREALVIDPGRDVGIYLDAAAKEGLRIVAITETHIHADLLSGSRELAARTGARIYLSDEGGPDWTYDYAKEAGASPLKGGSVIRIGGVRIEARHTPGHTPEHLSFVLTDERASSEPVMVFTGDFVFVGDVGRPDLLEAAAGVKGAMEPAARSLFRSLASFKDLPEHLLLWPAHGSGSACGKSLGGVPVSTLGYEKRTNWGLRATIEESFLNEVLSGQPEPPKYFATTKRLNKEGPPLLSDASYPLFAPRIPQSVVVDIRSPEEFAQRHARGSLNLPLYQGFVGWAGWLLSYDDDVHLIAESPHEVDEAVRRLSLIGLDRVTSWSGPESFEGYPTESHRQRSFSDGIQDGALLVDVRNRAEWLEGHVPGATHIPLGYLPDRIAEIPLDHPIAVYCQGGSRSPVAASVLLARGARDVTDMNDGYQGFLALNRK